MRCSHDETFASPRKLRQIAIGGDKRFLTGIAGIVLTSEHTESRERISFAPTF